MGASPSLASEVGRRPVSWFGTLRTVLFRGRCAYLGGIRSAAPKPKLALFFLAAIAMAVPGGNLRLSQVPGADQPGRAHAQPAGRWTLAEVRGAAFDPGTLFDARGITASAGGEFFAVDRGHDRIVVVDASGTVVSAFGAGGSGPGQLDGPRDVALDSSNDRVYVTDYENRRLAVFTLAGVPAGDWIRAGPDHDFAPHSVAVGPDGTVFVLSVPSTRIERFDPAGVWLGGWGVIGSAPGELSNPEALAVLPDGSVAVADTGNRRIQVFAPDGSALLRSLPVRGVWDIAAQPGSGRVAALQDSAGGARDEIAVYGSDWSLERSIVSGALPPAERFAPAVGVAIGADGRVAVGASFGAPGRLHGLRQYAAGGSMAAVTLADPLAFAGFLEPRSISVGPTGDLYVLDAALGVTKRYAPDGSLVRRYDAAWGDELAVGPDGGMHIVSTSGEVLLRRVGDDDRETWARPCDCFSGVGVAGDAERVWVTTAISQSMAAYSADPTPADPLAAVALPDPPYAWPLDLAMAPDGRLWAAGGESGGVTAHDSATGAIVDGFDVSSIAGPRRISVAPDGTLFVLQLDDTVAAFRQTGELLQAWVPEPIVGSASSAPMDIAAAPDGRLYVLDGASSAVLVYERKVSSVTPTPIATAEPGCTTIVDKTASPSVLPLGATTTLDLSFEIRCSEGRERLAEIMLLIDRSNSMAGTKLAAAKGAATSFVSSPDLNLALGRLGLVTFSDVVSLDQPLTTDRDAMRSAIAAVNHGGATDIAGAFRRAAQHVAEAGRADARAVMLMMTDGRPNREGQPYVEAYLEAARVRASGGLVYTIGLGDTVVDELMVAMAGSADRYFPAPDAASLAPIYDELSRSVGSVVATEARLEDMLGADVDYVPGSASAGGVESGRTIRWDLGTLGSGAGRVTLDVRPTRIGTVPTNEGASLEFVAEGRRFLVEFPIPEVEVFVPPTASPTPPPSPTPEVRRVYLPLALRASCQLDDSRVGADIVLVIDTSSSMAGAKLEAARGAASGFLDLLDDRRDRVGLVTFEGEAHRLHPLTANFAAVSTWLGAMTTGYGTRIDLGLEEALREIGYRAREGSERVVIVLSDGRPTGGTEARTRDLGRQIREAGIVAFTIGLGSDADPELLTDIAGALENYYPAPSPDDLAEIYSRIARALPCR